VSGEYIWVFFFLLVLVVFVALWLYARRVKDNLDSSPTVLAEARARVVLTEKAVGQLRALSADPILLKQDEAGVRVQIEHRPMLPLMAFVGQEVSAALAEAAGRVSEKLGARWVVVLTVAEDGGVSVQRLV